MDGFDVLGKVSNWKYEILKGIYFWTVLILLFMQILL